MILAISQDRSPCLQYNDHFVSISQMRVATYEEYANCFEKILDAGYVILTSQVVGET